MAAPMAIGTVLNFLKGMKGSGGGGGDGDDGDSGGDSGFDKFKSRLKDVNSGMDRLSFNMASLNIPMNVIQGGRDLAFTFDKLNIALAQTTGYTEHLSKGMLDLTAESYELGLSFEEAQKITAELALNFRKFPALSESVRLSLSKVAAQLHQVGVNSKDSSRSIDIFVSALGKTPAAAADSMQSIHLLAQEVGRSTSSMVQEFNSFAPKLLKYGDGYEHMFARLQRSARAYRLDAAEALNITDQFDTFEGAAQKVGALNAVFGRYGLMLNDAEIREMDEGERLEHIGQQFRNVGLSVENLTRRQRQFAAQQLTGGNQDMLFRFLGGQPREQLNDYTKQQETLEEGSLKMTDTIQRIQGASQKFFIDSGLMNRGINDMNLLADSFQKVAKNGATIVDFYFEIGKIYKDIKFDTLIQAVALGKELIPGVTPQFMTDPGRRGEVADRLARTKAKPVPDIFIPATPAETAGTNFITGPAGTFKLRGDDSILAGTDLGGGGLSAKDIETAVAKGMQTALKMMKTPSSRRNVQVVLNNRIVGEVVDGIEKQYGLLSPS